MSQRPLIGITGRRRTAGDVARMPRAMAGLDLDLYFASYAKQVEMAGGIGVHLTRDGSPEILERLDGLVLTGGADVDPAAYGAEPDPDLGVVEHGRDDREFPLLDLAAVADALGRPVLIDADVHLVAIGTSTAHRQQAMGDRRAPDAAVFDLQGDRRQLSEWSGTRRLLGVFSTW